jgi:hypothetical protein
VLLWGRAQIPALLGNARLWGASGYSPLVLDPPDLWGRRRRQVSRCIVSVAGVQR